MQKIAFFQSLWATELRRWNEPERPVEERFDMVKDDGWEGLCIDLGSTSLEDAWSYVPFYKKTGLRGLVTAFPNSPKDLRDAIKLAKEIGAPFVIVIGMVMPVRIEDMINEVRALLKVSAEEGMPIQFETHRNCLTNDLFATLQMMEAVPEMRLAADLSHYVVQREMMQPISADYQAMMRKVLDRSDSFQGRIGTRNQVQVPLHYPQYKIWVDTFVDWWTYGLKEWKARAGANDEVIFMSELGPTEYAMMNQNGEEFSDRRQEALQLRQMASEIWLKI